MARTRTPTLAALALTTLFVAGGSPAARAGTTSQSFGKTADGHAVERYTLTNAKGATVEVLTYGATIARVRMPDKAGHLGDVLLGYDTLGEYERDTAGYLGGVLGRVSGRIAKGTFTIDGVTSHVPINNAANAMHGGKIGYDKRVWSAEPVNEKGGEGVKLTLVDPAGEQGFPGTVHAAVTYTLSDANVLRVYAEATTDKPTPINFSSHGFWNLKDAGKTTVADEQLKVLADKYLPVDDEELPTGAISPVAGTPFDFRTAKPLSRDLAAVRAGDGYNNTLVLEGESGKLRLAAQLYEAATGRTLDLYTTTQAVQLYTGGYLKGGFTGHDGVRYNRYAGVVLAAEDYPDAVNHPTFPGEVYRPGKTYRQATEYRFGTSEHAPK